MSDLQVSSQMPGVQVASPILASKVEARGEIRRRIALYDYRHGRVMYPSKRENALIEAWVKTFSYAECCRVLESEGLGKISPMTAMRWLKRDHVEEWKNRRLEEKAKASGYTKDHWRAVGVDLESGRVEFTAFQLMAWKEMGKACGYYEAGSGGVTLNQQINFTQANGNA